MIGKETRVVDLDDNSTAQTLSFHLNVRLWQLWNGKWENGKILCLT